jgi:hypothetical protein
MTEQFQELLTKGALERVRDPLSPGFFSRIFLVPKKSGGWRPIIDLKALNVYLSPKKFKMESAESIRANLRQGMWTYSLDLKDAYFHIPVHPSSRKFLRVCFRGTVYQFRALPFGLSSAPWLFTQVAKEFASLVHQEGTFLHQFLDDWLGRAPSRELCAKHCAQVVALAQELGWIINWEKSEPEPQQNFTFVGIHYDLVAFQAQPTEENWNKLTNAARKVCSRQTMPARLWQSVIGTFMGQSRLIAFGHLHVRPLQWDLASQWSQFRDSPRATVRVSSTSADAARWWLQQDPAAGVPVTPPPYTTRVFTDACPQGWGAHLGEATLQGRWSQEESKLHINILEMRAVSLALNGFPIPRGSHILVSTDNTTVVAYVNRQGGTRSRLLLVETQQLFSIVMERGWSLRAVHIPGHLNVIADLLSRENQVLPTEWSLHPRISETLFQRWGRPHVDLFATRFNNKLPVFVSPVPDPGALDTDALSMRWDNLWAYAYPPHQILTKVITKLREHRCEVILVAPAWPAQPWFPDLLQLSVEHPLRLPAFSKLLCQPRSDRFHLDPESLNLHAWRLSGAPSRTSDSRREPQRESRLPRLPPPLESTRASGECFVIGARNGESVLSLPLCPK